MMKNCRQLVRDQREIEAESSGLSRGSFRRSWSSRISMHSSRCRRCTCFSSITTTFRLGLWFRLRPLWRYPSPPQSEDIGVWRHRSEGVERLRKPITRARWSRPRSCSPTAQGRRPRQSCRPRSRRARREVQERWSDQALRYQCGSRSALSSQTPL